jgi:hypothetical protein
MRRRPGSIIEASREEYGPDMAVYLHAVLLTNVKTIVEVSKMSKSEEARFYEVVKKAGLTAKFFFGGGGNRRGLW